MKHSSNTRPIVSAAVLLTAAFAVSCQMEDEGMRTVTEQHALRFELSAMTAGTDSVITRSMSPIECEGTPYAFEMSCTEEESQPDGQTRADLVNSVSSESFAGNGFGLYGFDATGVKVIDGVAVSVSGTTGTPDTDYRWKKDAQMSFVGFYPKGETIFSGAKASGAWSFGYTVPTTAAAQKDLMLAYFTGQSSTGTAPLSFTHPLTCVRIVIGEMDAAQKERMGDITSITLKGVYKSGTCTVTPSGNSLGYSWAPSSDKVNVTSSDVTDITFAVIPQNLASSNVTLEMKSSKGMTFSVKLNSGEWKAGKTNTYTITAKFQASIDIDDTVTGLVKDNVVITNSGSKPAYVRARIVGNWHDGDGNIIAPWDPAGGTGTFTGLCGTGWTYNTTDSCYYFTSLVAPAQELKTANGNQLFTKYTVESSEFPEGAAELRITILVQCVVDDSAANYEAAWGM